MTRPVVASIDLLALRQNLQIAVRRAASVAPVGGRANASWPRRGRSGVR